MRNPMTGVVTSHYDMARKHPVLGTAQPHRGIDIAHRPRPALGEVRAVYGGRVVAVLRPDQWVDRGNNWGAIWGRSGSGVLIRNPDGEHQYYGHLSRIDVRNGDLVKEGQTIGREGSVGRVSGPHLHLEFHNRTSGPANNWTHTRDPMADFRAAGITPGLDTTITLASTPQEDTMTPEQMQELKDHIDTQIKSGLQWATVGYDGASLKKVLHEARTGAQAAYSGTVAQRAALDALTQVTTEMAATTTPLTAEDVRDMIRRIEDRAVEAIAADYEITRKEN